MATKRFYYRTNPALGTNIFRINRTRDGMVYVEKRVYVEKKTTSWDHLSPRDEAKVLQRVALDAGGAHGASGGGFPRGSRGDLVGGGFPEGRGGCPSDVPVDGTL